MVFYNKCPWLSFRSHTTATPVITAKQLLTQRKFTPKVHKSKALLQQLFTNAHIYKSYWNIHGHQMTHYIIFCKDRANSHLSFVLSSGALDELKICSFRLSRPYPLDDSKVSTASTGLCTSTISCVVYT